MQLLGNFEVLDSGQQTTLSASNQSLVALLAFLGPNPVAANRLCAHFSVAAGQGTNAILHRVQVIGSNHPGLVTGSSQLALDQVTVDLWDFLKSRDWSEADLVQMKVASFAIHTAMPNDSGDNWIKAALTTRQREFEAKHAQVTAEIERRKYAEKVDVLGVAVDRISGAGQEIAKAVLSFATISESAQRIAELSDRDSSTTTNLEKSVGRLSQLTHGLTTTESSQPNLTPLSLGDVEVEDDGKSVLAGDQPRLQDLRHGAIVSRKIELARVGEQLRAIQTRSDLEDQVKICWITAPSGTGKSMFLLDLAKSLVESGSTAYFCRTLEGLIDVASSRREEGQTCYLMLDDINDPDRRLTRDWERLYESLRRSPDVTIVTASTPSAYEDFISKRSSLFAVHEFKLDFDHQLGPYKEWLVKRTGTSHQLLKGRNPCLLAWQATKNENGLDAFCSRLTSRLEPDLRKLFRAYLASSVLKCPFDTTRFADFADAAAMQEAGLLPSDLSACLILHSSVAQEIYRSMLGSEGWNGVADDLLTLLRFCIDRDTERLVVASMLRVRGVAKSFGCGSDIERLGEKLAIGAAKQIHSSGFSEGSLRAWIHAITDGNKAHFGFKSVMTNRHFDSLFEAWGRSSTGSSNLAYYFSLVRTKTRSRSIDASRWLAWLSDNVSDNIWPGVFRIGSELAGPKASEQAAQAGLTWLKEHPNDMYFLGVALRLPSMRDENQAELQQLLLIFLETHPNVSYRERDLWDLAISSGLPRDIVYTSAFKRVGRAPGRISRNLAWFRANGCKCWIAIDHLWLDNINQDWFRKLWTTWRVHVVDRHDHFSVHFGAKSKWRQAGMAWLRLEDRKENRDERGILLMLDAMLTLPWPSGSAVMVEIVRVSRRWIFRNRDSFDKEDRSAFVGKLSRFCAKYGVLVPDHAVVETGLANESTAGDGTIPASW